MSKNEVLISPQKLYPTESLVFIKNDRLQFYIDEYKKGANLEKPVVFLFDNNYYILKGHHLVLAAAMAQVTEICVEVEDYKQYLLWSDEETIKENLRSIGMSTLYDYETIGGFTYETYPEYYKKR